VRNTDVILFMNNRSAVEKLIQTCTKYQISRWAEYTPELGPMQYSHFPSRDACDSIPVPEDDIASEEEVEEEEEIEELQSNSQTEEEEGTDFQESQGLSKAKYKIIDLTKEFNTKKQNTGVKYQTKNDKKISAMLARIDLFEYYCSKY
jgi:Rps23 Pro-64 3,4-dihydroxylase Tpa1-like proline 4-hydroxylase